MTATPDHQSSEWIDPRIRRTRQMLQQSLERLLESKSFDKISVGEIAEDATLNRATFYDHYPDKYALLEGLVSTRFQELLTRRGLFFEGGCPSAIKGIALAVCDFLAGLPGIECPERRQFQKHLESALVSVVRGMILTGLQRHTPPPGPPPALIAATVSGAIYGAAIEWLRTPNRCPAEEAVESIFALIHAMLL
jgi:AcrR family transcriptional regulator